MNHCKDCDIRIESGRTYCRSCDYNRIVEKKLLTAGIVIALVIVGIVLAV